MATLTTSWQSLGSATLYSGITVHLDAKYSSQNTANNASPVQIRLRSVGTRWRTTSGTAKFTGAYTDSKSCATYPNYIESGDTIFSISKTVKHNDDGTKSISIGGSVQAYINGASRTATISNKTVTLPKINRLATVTSTDDFTDEENPTLSFNNPADFTVYPYLNFYDDSDTLVYQLIRNTTSATSPYVWDITDDERTALRKATNKQQTYKVSVGVDTYDGTTKLGNNSLSKTMRYVNSEPSQSTTFTETNQKVIDVLGTDTAEMIIQNVSQVKLTATPITKKEATVSKISFEHNNILVDITSSPYEYIFTPSNSKFKTIIKDSRGYSIENEYTKPIVEYFSINIDSFSFKRENPTSSNIILNAQIGYKQTVFGSHNNSPTIQWSLGEDGDLQTLSDDDYTIDYDNDKIIISNLLLQDVLPYNAENRFYLHVNDLLTEDDENDIVPKGIPTCDMGEHDFQVNGDLFIADEDRENAKEIRALFFPIGAVYTTSSNVSPGNFLGGEWELIDKTFITTTSDDTSNFTEDNLSDYGIVFSRAGHSIYIRLSFASNVALSDTTVTLGTINLTNLGVSSLVYTKNVVGYSDGGNGVFMCELVGSSGVVSVLDILGDGSTIPAGSNCKVEFINIIQPENMLDSACDSFVWKRIS